MRLNCKCFQLTRVSVEQNQSWLSFDWMKDYFDVTNLYVLKKIRLVFFPFGLKDEEWRRQESYGDFQQDSNASVLMTPRGDLQAPDLYIPLMSFVTFILLVGIQKGATEASLDFDTFSYVCSKSLFLWIFEAGIIYGCFFFLGLAKPAYLEILSYSGYKFLILSFTVMTDILLGYYPSYAVMWSLSGLYAFFFFKTLHRFAGANTLQAHIQDVSVSRKTFFMGNAIAQVVLIWLYSYY